MSSAQKMKCIIFLGTVRENRLGLRVAKFMEEMLKKHNYETDLWGKLEGAVLKWSFKHLQDIEDEMSENIVTCVIVWMYDKRIVISDMFIGQTPWNWICLSWRNQYISMDRKGKVHPKN